MRTGATLGFPISETPCFFPQSLMSSLAATGVDLVNQILDSPDAMAAAMAAVPERFNGPGAETLPTFVQVDFGLVRNADGLIEPKLVELQAFASLYGFQLAVAEAYRDAFGLSSSLCLYLDRLDSATVSRAREGPRDRRRPRSRRGRADGNRAAQTEDVARLRRHGTDVGRARGRCVGGASRRTAAVLPPRRQGPPEVKRIYNRVIPDELERKRIQLPFGYGDDLDVEWAGTSGLVFPDQQVLDSVPAAPLGS